MTSVKTSEPPQVPFVTLEEHWLSPEAAVTSRNVLLEQGFPEATLKKLEDVSAEGVRLSEMTKNNISLQVISHVAAPGEEPANPSVAECRASNDQLAQRVSQAPVRQRYRGFARLPMEKPDEAATELRRCVQELGFVGALVDNTLDLPTQRTRSVFFDHASYDVVWQACCDLDVPFYIHPSYPPEGPETPQYRFAPSADESFPAKAGWVLGAFGYGWHADTALHFLRLVAAGVFDRFPRLKLVLGHFGEGLPFFIERSVRGIAMGNPNLKRNLLEIWRENVWITTSGMWGKAPVAAALQVTRAERVLFSVDYPFSANEKGVEFMSWLWGSGLVSEDAWRGIAYGNALSLLKIGEGELHVAR